ncbi:MAG: DoxX family protein [Bryobacteraceae bacterium]
MAVQLRRAALGGKISMPSNMSKAQQWGARIATALPVLMLVMSAGMKFAQPPAFVEGFARFGYPMSQATGIGVVELLGTVIYLVPRTSVLGAILLTGYLGGAVATHVRVGDVFLGPLSLGVLVWLGLYLRDPRIRALIPLLSR